MRPVGLVAVALVAAAMPPPSAAQTFKCRDDLVSVGDSRATVLLKCGEPVARDTVCRPLPAPSPRPASGVRPGQIVPCENVDEWTYNAASGQFMTTLRFAEGRLVAIEYGERVK
jgi:hypothetical protein